MSKIQFFAAVTLLAFASTPISLAQTMDRPSAPMEKVLYSFTGGIDGGDPQGSLVRDSKGNLYGVTYHGGSSAMGVCGQSGGCGTVFKLSKMPGGTWQEKVIYNFCPVAGCVDGNGPVGGLVMDSLGVLYGVTFDGGEFNGGTVFALAPAGKTWVETVLHHFCSASQCLDGLNPDAGLVLDGNGNLWGTTLQGGGGAAEVGAGVVFEISPVSSGWVETVLYAFCMVQFCPDGAAPHSSVAFDLGGNLYATAYTGGLAHCPNTYSCGTVFALSPATTGFWPYSGLYDFCPVSGCLDGELPVGGVAFDVIGHLFGTATGGGAKNGGVLFELVSSSSGDWQYSVIHNFCSISSATHNCTDGSSPANNLVVDLSNNIFGTTLGGGNGGGVVFKFVPKLNGWQETVLHSFCTKAGCPDGNGPSGTPIFDSAGNLYGTTSGGGTGNTLGGAGVVYEIVP